MPNDYHNLNDLISQHSEAGEYFNSLPEYVRDHISSRGDNVTSFEALCDYAENLLRGDD